MAKGGKDTGKGKGSGGTMYCECSAAKGNLMCMCTKHQWFASKPDSFICPDCSQNKHVFTGLEG